MSGQFRINANTLDKIDWILLSVVQSDARVSFAELGRRAGLSAPAAAERLKRLEDKGVVLGYHARVNPSKLGLPIHVFIEIEVKRVDYPRFQKAIANLPWILECHHISGRPAFLLKAAAPDTAGLEALIGHLNQFGGTATSLVFSTTLDRREFHDDSSPGTTQS